MGYEIGENDDNTEFEAKEGLERDNSNDSADYELEIDPWMNNDDDEYDLESENDYNGGDEIEVQGEDETYSNKSREMEKNIRTENTAEGEYARQGTCLVDEGENFGDMKSTMKRKDSENITVERSVRAIGQEDLAPTHEEASSSVSDDTLQAITEIKAILKQRPVSTTRFIKHRLPHLNDKQVMAALPYCDYKFRDGPWQRATVRFGYDPRHDSQSRMYQTLVFKMDFRPIIEDNPENRRALPRTHNELKACFPHILPGPENIPHIFNGIKFMTEDNVWQIDDLLDSALRRVADTNELRSIVSWKCGWFPNGTMAKLCTIMEDKLSRLKDNRPSLDYECLLHTPDNYTGTSSWDGEGYGLSRGQMYTKEQWELRNVILKLARILQ